MIHPSFALALLVWLMLGDTVRAQAPAASARLVVHVRVEQAEDAELFERLRGQTSDLAVELVRYAEVSAPTGFAESIGLAFEHCRASTVDAVVWAVRSQPERPDGWLVALATCKDERLLVRHLGSEQPALPAEAGSSSGVLETAALVLRGGLSVLLRGGSIGITRPPPPIAPDALAIVPTPPLRLPAPASAPRVQMVAGLQQVWDGSGARGQPALYSALAWGTSRLWLGAAAALGVPVPHRDRYTNIELTRHMLALSARAELLERTSWSVNAGMDAGALVYRRVTRARSDSARARAAERSFAPLASPTASIARRLGPLWLTLELGADIVPVVPRFVYRSAKGTHEAIGLWPVAPRAVLSLGLRRP